MNKPYITVLLIIIAAGAATGVFFLKKSADVAREKSDKILKDFKAIDESLQKSQQLFDSVRAGLKDSLQEK